MTRCLGIVVLLLSVLRASTPVFAGENWLDSVDQYIAEIRQTIQTTDMDGYLSAEESEWGSAA